MLASGQQPLDFRTWYAPPPTRCADHTYGALFVRAPKRAGVNPEQIARLSYSEQFVIHSCTVAYLSIVVKRQFRRLLQPKRLAMPNTVAIVTPPSPSRLKLAHFRSTSPSLPAAQLAAMPRPPCPNVA